jgi:antitoxin (DNA-binding transcriptional repressor) of toxin-antitoxin stability system
MHAVGLKVLKNKLSEYIRLVASGETILVTDRDRVVAEIRPPQGRGPYASDAALGEVMRRGLLTPPMVVREGPPERAPVASFSDLMDELDASRDNR